MLFYEYLKYHVGFDLYEIKEIIHTYDTYIFYLHAYNYFQYTVVFNTEKILFLGHNVTC